VSQRERKKGDKNANYYYNRRNDSDRNGKVTLYFVRKKKVYIQTEFKEGNPIY